MAWPNGTTWDETTPDNNTEAIYIDDYNMDLRKGLRSRLALEHEWPASQAATSEAGIHKYMTLQRQGLNDMTAAVAGTQIGAIYASTVGTTGDALFFMNVGTKAQNISDKVYFWHMGGDATTGANVSSTLYVINDCDIKVARAYLSVTASSGTGVMVDILYDGNSIWTDTTKQLIMVNTLEAEVVAASIATGALAAGGLLTIDIDSIGGGTAGAGLTVMLQVG